MENHLRALIQQTGYFLKQHGHQGLIISDRKRLNKYKIITSFSFELKKKKTLRSLIQIFV